LTALIRCIPRVNVLEAQCHLDTLSELVFAVINDIRQAKTRCAMF